jgi:peptidoglycan/LPS O-acetylase OafA/YrhL
VLLYHHSPERLPGGFLGVSLFFTLSGYLITTLLLREHAEHGEISLRRFWVRRARRLVPVALAGLALATLVAWWTRAKGGLPAVSGDVRYAAANLANWHQIGEGADYGDALTAPSPVTHYWSLAIEEQFYLAYPVVAAVALRYRRRALTALLLLATAASVIAQLLTSSVNRAYLGTDTRLAELTVGALLATYLAARRPHAHRRRWDALGIAGLVALGVAWATVELGDERLFEGGLLLHALVAASVIAAARHGGRLPRLLGQPALASLGLLSYGVYVVHFPLYLLLTPDRVPVAGPTLLVVRIAASVALAAGLHWLVERPVRWGGSLPGWHGALGWATATAAVVVLAVAMPHVGRTGARAELRAGLSSD